MRILVTGAAGMLGTSLVPVLRSRDHSVMPTDINLLTSDVSELDVRRIEDMLATSRKYRPELLMHLAAETNLEVCETKVDYAFEENFIGTQNACVAANELDIPLVYVSTAGVFDGTKKTPYIEFDTPNPINVYGSSKYWGEMIVRETVPNHFIVRAGWMVGGGERDKKFVHKIVDQMRAGSKTIRAVNDRMGTPTYAPAFSEVLARLIATRLYGTYHLACKGTATRYDVARHMVGVLGRKDVEVLPVNSEFFREEYFAPRPVSEEMTNYVLELRGMNDMPHWKDAIERYVREHYSDVQE